MWVHRRKPRPDRDRVFVTCHRHHHDLPICPGFDHRNQTEPPARLEFGLLFPTELSFPAAVRVGSCPSKHKTSLTVICDRCLVSQLGEVGRAAKANLTAIYCHTDDALAYSVRIPAFPALRLSKWPSHPAIPTFFDRPEPLPRVPTLCLERDDIPEPQTPNASTPHPAV